MKKLALAVVTLLTLVVAGATFEIGGNVSDVWQAPELLAPGLSYAGAVAGLLLLRELAYFLAGRRHGVAYDAPYMVPVPNLFGTLGPIHVGPAPTKAALFDRSAAAVLTTVAISLAMVALGLHWSDTLDSPQIASPSLAFGQPLLFQWVMALVKPEAVENGAAWHPLAFAGWTGLLLTAVTLLPVGQSDGGHMGYALLGRRQAFVASGTLAALVGVGFALSAPLWIVWVLITLLLGHRHPVVGGDEKLGVGRMVVAVVLVAVLALCFTAQPTGAWTRHS